MMQEYRCGTSEWKEYIKFFNITWQYVLVFFTILFTSTTLGDEQSQEVQDAFGRELRAGRKTKILLVDRKALRKEKLKLKRKLEKW